MQTRFGAGVESVDGREGDLRVTLTSNETLRAAIVVVGIGAIPNDAWLSSSGLLIDDGVVCDEFSRAVGHPGVFAVGDVVRWRHPGHQEDVRVEHWTNAAEQAACVAHNITHPDELRSYAPTEYVWSDQYDWKIQIAGRPHRATLDRIVGDMDVDPPQSAAVFGDQTDADCGCHRQLAEGLDAVPQNDWRGNDRRRLPGGSGTLTAAQRRPIGRRVITG